MTNPVFRLHPLSFVFESVKTIKHMFAPVAGASYGLAHMQNKYWIIVPSLLVIVHAILKSTFFSCEFGKGELLVRDGVFNKTQRHIPFSRIQGVSQRRKLFHRLLGVAEVQLDSSAGDKPEAVMNVLSIKSAAALEDLLRHADTQEAIAQPHAATHQAAAPAPAPAAQVLHTLSAADLVRFGIVSNRGAVLFGVTMGTLMNHNETRKFTLHAMGKLPLDGVKSTLASFAAEGHWLYFVMTVALLYALALVAFSGLSIVLAFLRHHGFVLELQGNRLMQRHGLSTDVRSGARINRLQRFVLHETWWHRLMHRCRLSVDVVGGRHHKERASEASTKFSDLAPIATMEQAKALLQVCLPGLDWNALHWQPLHDNAVKRRLMVQARWMLPAMIGLAGLDYAYGWRVPLFDLVFVYTLAVVASVLLAKAWLRFAAFAETDDLIVFRSGVWHRKWVIVRATRLQTVSLHTSPLDRSLGLVQLKGDIQGGSKGLNIPCLGPEVAERLRAQLWRHIV